MNRCDFSRRYNDTATPAECRHGQGSNRGRAKGWDWIACRIIPQDVYDECMALIEKGEPAGAVIEADYSALEVVTLAAFSKDQNLVKALLENIDRVTA